jgi:hypothetical protein
MADKPYKGVGPADRAIREGVAQSLEIIGADLTGKAQRLAPKREGTLRGSGRWEIENGVGFKAGNPGSVSAEIAVRVTFDVPYAEVQHERTDFRHTNGEAKYLERPQKENALKYRRYIERAIEQQLRRRT